MDKQAGKEMIVAVVAPAEGAVMQALPAIDGVTFLVHNTLEAFAAEPTLPDAEALVFVAAGGDKSILSPLFAKLPSVRWVHSFFAGVDALKEFFEQSLQGKGVPVTNGKGAFSASLAEWVMTAILHFNKQIPRVIKNREEKRWEKFVMNTVAGKTLGIVGYGDIGQSCARAAKQGFGMRVLAVRNNPDRPSPHADKVYSTADKLELFRESDFVVCALPGTGATLNYCGAEEFAAMKPEGVFISIGRGLAVDEVALAEALASKSIAAAAVDVFKEEPLPEGSPLWSAENVLLTSHNADFTSDYFDLGWRVFQDNLRAYRAGDAQLPTAIALDLGY